MQKELYNIDRLKYYFRSCIYYGNKDLLHFSKLGSTNFVERERRFGSVLIGVGIITTVLFWLFFGNSSDIIQTIVQDRFSVFCNMSGYLLIVHGAYVHYMLGRYMNLETYLTLKSTLQIFIQKFRKNIHIDANSEKIDPIELEGIQKNIETISKVLNLITGPLIKFRKISSYLSTEGNEVLENFITFETGWIIEYVSDFRELLSKWLKIHENELSKYQKENINTKNQEIRSLVSTRLTSHIENIEKVRINV